jgi:hypothetical protein
MANAVGFVAVRERGLVAQWHMGNSSQQVRSGRALDCKSSPDNWDDR